MQLRALALSAVVSCVLTAACGDNDTNLVAGSGGTATMRFANATDSAVDVVNNRTTLPTGGNLGFGASAACAVVSTSIGLQFKLSNTAITIPGFTQSFTTNGTFTVILYPVDSTAAFATLNNAGFLPVHGFAGLRVFNAATPPVIFTVLADGDSVGPGVVIPRGTASPFMNVPSGNRTITVLVGLNSKAAVQAGILNLAADQNFTLVVAPPLPGTLSLRSFLIDPCG